MTSTEDNAWYLCAGILMGMVLCFWFCPDIEFFRHEWVAMMAILLIWVAVRWNKNDNTGDKGKPTERNDSARAD